MEISVVQPDVKQNGPAGRHKRSKLFVTRGHDIVSRTVIIEDHASDFATLNLAILLMPRDKGMIGSGQRLSRSVSKMTRLLVAGPDMLFTVPGTAAWCI